MADTLRVVEAAADLEPDEKVRLVVRMLLGMNEMSTLELGVNLGLGRTAIYDRTQGRTPFTVSELVRMAAVFDVPPSVFLMGPRALLGAAVEQPKIVPGSIKNRGLAASTSPARPTGRLSLVAA